MITHQDNELMCRVEGDAPMGEMLRDHFWVPGMLSNIVQAGGRPHRLTLIGKKLVVFRGHDGRLGALNEGCPHRGVSLALGRNEDNALRCIYHGWKFSVDGKCVDVPTQALAKEQFCKSVPVRSYPVHESSGIIWFWLGDPDNPAPIPQFEFSDLPDDHILPTRQDVPYNWVQGVEGTMDTSHVGILHQSWLAGAGDLAKTTQNLSPKYEFDDRDHGFLSVALRDLPDGAIYSRMNEFVFPWYAMLAPSNPATGDRAANFIVPIDDTNAMFWFVQYNPDRPIDRHMMRMSDTSDPNHWPPYEGRGRPDLIWGQDPLIMKVNFSGFKVLHEEDFACQESQGVIADRTKEFLNAADGAITRVRRLLLKNVKQFAETGSPEMSERSKWDHRRSRGYGFTSTPERPWRQILKEEDLVDAAA